MADRQTAPESRDSSVPKKRRVVAGIEIPPPGPEEIISETGFGAKLLDFSDDMTDDEVKTVHR